MTIESRAYARAGLLGNPSDGYFGKIIAVAVKNFYASVSLRESKELNIEPCSLGTGVYKNIRELVVNIELYGYYSGIRLVKAAIKKFFDHCQDQSIQLEDKNFSIRYESNIPRQLGLGGSSAIITAVIRALMEFYKVDIPHEVLPSLILEAESKELGINAGLMDRVVQVYGGCVYMDLNQQVIEEKGYGIYERLDPKLLPDLYLAYKPTLGKVSGQVLDDIRMGYERGDKLVLDTLKRLAEIAETGKKALLQGNFEQFRDLMNENFNLRSRIMKISEGNFELVRAARDCGASAKFAGSGGSIIGMYSGERMYARLRTRLEKLGAEVVKPKIE
ncbi:MAG: GHMP kinase [Candidatus Aminicenantes bacterium]|nr:GHMP kinase [Candidatus Aminicenantes bacterium]MDH5706003.1 GHMP kinase [Candidatus Aminicenantes bacterium]